MTAEPTPCDCDHCRGSIKSAPLPCPGCEGAIELYVWERQHKAQFLHLDAPCAWWLVPGRSTQGVADELRRLFGMPVLSVPQRGAMPS